MARSDPTVRAPGRPASSEPNAGEDAAAERSTTLVLDEADDTLTRAESLVRRLQRAILDGELEPGRRLGTRKDLAARHRVARGTLNEALRVLQTRGLIEARPGPGGGVFVSASVPYLHLRHGMLRLRRGRGAVEEAIRVRNALEPLVAVEAATHHRRQDLADFRELLSRMAAEEDPVARLKFNWALHLRIAESGSNTLLTGIYTDLMKFVNDSLADVESDPGTARDVPENIRIHRDLVEAIASRDPEAAADAARRHTPPIETASEPKRTSRNER